jgi:tetratricopeptide (TPR) repeat protein
MKKNILFLSLSLIFPLNFLNATTASKVELKCPVCEKACKGFELMSTNSFGGQDRDFFNRARGAQSIILLPVTCGSCLFSGYTNDFKKPVISIELKKKILKDKILKAPDLSKSLFKKMNRGMITEGCQKNSEGLPSWAKTDLIGQIGAMENKPLTQQARTMSVCSWCVRIEENPFASLIRGVKKSDLDWLQKETEQFQKNGRARNPAVEEIEIAEKMYSNWKNVPEERKKVCALEIGYLLRTHGENQRLLSILPTLKDAFTPEEWKELKPQIENSIELEGNYLKKAAEIIQKILSDNNEKSKLKKAELPIYNYLLGELYRRQGKYPKALKYFNIAAKMKEVPGWLQTYIKEQKALCR